MTFLSAHWKHLLLANYEVAPSILEPFVPARTKIDAFEGRILLSLVAFLFDKTRVLGMPIPFHRRFAEVNLRFYVVPDHDTSIRAVTFIQEIVPKPIIPWIANTLFSENYVALPMDHGCSVHETWYSWTSSNTHRFSASIDGDLDYPKPGSVSEFITEHYWGYASGRNSTLEYQVEHPPWKCCEIEAYDLAVDFAGTYGETFRFLNDAAPYNVLYAEGSPVKVSFPKRIRR